MRKILIFLGLLFVMLSGVYAQKGRQAIGFGLSYGTEIESIGLGLKYQYNITNPIRLEPSLNYFIENDNVSMLDIIVHTVTITENIITNIIKNTRSINTTNIIGGMTMMIGMTINTYRYKSILK